VGFVVAEPSKWFRLQNWKVFSHRSVLEEDAPDIRQSTCIKQALIIFIRLCRGGCKARVSKDEYEGERGRSDI
jgi:hypothetical protein